MSHYDWNTVPLEKLNALLSRRVIHTPALTIAKLTLKKGAIVPLHHHENEQITMMESGSLRFELAGENIVVRAGETLCIPPNAPHLVEALEDSQATDVFTPPRADWIRGDDAYLRQKQGDNGPLPQHEDTRRKPRSSGTLQRGYRRFPGPACPDLPDLKQRYNIAHEARRDRSRFLPVGSRPDGSPNSLIGSSQSTATGRTERAAKVHGPDGGCEIARSRTHCHR